MNCKRCEDWFWVCEGNKDESWDGELGNGAGVPCPDCNPSDRDNPPREHAGFTPLCGTVRF